MVRTLLRSGLLFLGLAGTALAAPQKETFRDWAAGLDEVDTGEDLRRTCRAETSAAGADGLTATLAVAIGNGDVLPPDAYPAILISMAAAPSGDGIPVAFETGGKRLAVQATGDGKQVTINNVKETSLALLRAMAAGGTVDITVAGKPGPALSLKGFTAAYRQLGAWCGFPTGDVAK
ncbi:MAG: hypothetical protein ACOZAM_22205 [Pseudomonadota bacterium]